MREHGKDTTVTLQFYPCPVCIKNDGSGHHLNQLAKCFLAQTCESLLIYYSFSNPSKLIENTQLDWADISIDCSGWIGLIDGSEVISNVQGYVLIGKVTLIDVLLAFSIKSNESF